MFKLLFDVLKIGFLIITPITTGLYSDLSMSGMCCLLTVATGMLTYTNANTITYGGYVNLLKRQLALSVRFLVAHVSSGPLSVVTAILACLTIVFAILGAISPEFATFDDDDNK